MVISDLSNLKNKEEVKDLRGWVDTIRHHGGLMFFELRDHETNVQIVTDKPNQFDNLKNEFYVSVTGTLVNRKKENVNKEVLFGDLEIELSNLEVISESKTLPFQIEDNIETDEQIRLKHRYLDIRRKEMNNNIIARSNTFKSLREAMNKLDIIELDTPTLIKSTPEGAKDFIVPSRKSPGSFYALPQSPQMYKQLFMISGLKNYYQIAKCYRDEDSRKDRQPEFTQLDIEISNGDPEIVQKIIEFTMKHVLKNVYSIEVKTPFTKITYDEAMTMYGTDKPDLRIKETITDFTHIFLDTEISFIKETINNNGKVRGFVINKLLSRSEIDSLDEHLKNEGSPGLGWFKIENKKVSGPLAKILNEKEHKQIVKNNNCTMLFQSGNQDETSHYLDTLRRNIYNIPNENTYEFVWIDDFPYFEIENGELQPSHHPFTSPKDTSEFLSNPNDAKALHYDLVLNGIELGSGSQRINDPKLQKDVLSKWGLSESEINDRFGWFIEALSYGSPQHAGFAVGIDRFIAEMMNADSIRDVIPFPKTQSGLDPLTNAPSYLSTLELKEYNISIESIKNEE
ncbi:MAG: aspartate--tRNA ligase [Candidatus Actinomarinales bacterium]|nr:MAG: aspartate--tRNA ligase [Candidatus Actinomarinales bacterium]